MTRLRLGLPLAEADPATYYAGGDHGYLDYPTYEAEDLAG